MRVLISGAGIAGPTLAWFLAKAGARITIVEKSHSLLSQGQNVDMKGSAITVIKKMGLMDQIRRFNTTEKGTQFINPKGQLFALFLVKEGVFC
jgi:2-polyprenyl-6-methoxyphenol hydroxylase-like FAD-dependent oxidoreductase